MCFGDDDYFNKAKPKRNTKQVSSVMPTGVNIIISLQEKDEQTQEHAQTVMDRLGIKYQRAEPSSITDSWKFVSVDKSTIPTELPSYVEVIYLTAKQWNEEVDFLKEQLAKSKELHLFYQC
jgi:DNA mismatch repair ATPase MutL